MNSDTWTEIVRYLPTSMVSTILCLNVVKPKTMWKTLLERDYSNNVPKVKRGYSRLYKIYKTIVGSLKIDYSNINPFMVYGFCHRIFNELGHKNAVISLRALRMLVHTLRYEHHRIEHNGNRFISIMDVETIIDQVSFEGEPYGLELEPLDQYDDPFDGINPPLDARSNYELYLNALRSRRVPLVIRKDGIFKIVYEYFNIDLMKTYAYPNLHNDLSFLSHKEAIRHSKEEELYESALEDICPVSLKF